MHLGRGGVLLEAIGNVSYNGGHGEVWVPPQVVIRQHDVPQVLAVGACEPLPPVVGREAILPAAGGRLQAAGHVGAEAEVAAAECDGGRGRRGDGGRRRTTLRPVSLSLCLPFAFDHTVIAP